MTWSSHTIWKLSGARRRCWGKLFADAGDESLTPFRGLDMALALVDGALNLLRPFTWELLFKLPLYRVDVLHLPGDRASIFEGLIAHRSLSPYRV